MTHSSLIDWEQLDMIGDDFPPEFREIYDEFLKEIPELLFQLRHHVTAGDPGNASKVAHQIKGSSANFGFIGVSQPMSRLELETKGGSLESAQTWLAEAESAFQQAAVEVKEKRGL